MSLLDKYMEMEKEAAATETEKVATQVEASPEEEILHKYASWAEDALIKEAGEGNFTADDVEKLATLKMQEDAQDLYEREKVAEAYEMGQIMYAGFKAAAEADSNN